MTKGERRKARKAARTEGKPLAGKFSDTPKGRRALYRWARRYDELNRAPEGDHDR